MHLYKTQFQRAVKKFLTFLRWHCLCNNSKMFCLWEKGWSWYLAVIKSSAVLLRRVKSICSVYYPLVSSPQPTAWLANDWDWLTSVTKATGPSLCNGNWWPCKYSPSPTIPLNTQWLTYSISDLLLFSFIPPFTIDIRPPQTRVLRAFPV